MVLRLVLASIRNKQATLNASILVEAGNMGTASLLRYTPKVEIALPFIRLLIFSIWYWGWRDGIHISVFSDSEFCALKTDSIQIKCYRNRLSTMFLFGLMMNQVYNSTWDARGVYECLRLVHFSDLCEVTADVAEVVLLFGLTELTAQIAWIENVGFFTLSYDRIMSDAM